MALMVGDIAGCRFWIDMAEVAQLLAGVPGLASHPACDLVSAADQVITALPRLCWLAMAAAQVLPGMPGLTSYGYPAYNLATVSELILGLSVLSWLGCGTASVSDITAVAEISLDYQWCGDLAVMAQLLPGVPCVASYLSHDLVAAAELKVGLPSFSWPVGGSTTSARSG